MGDGQLSCLKGVLSAACLINPTHLNYKSNILPGTLSHSPLHIHMSLILLINTERLGAIYIMPLYLYSKHLPRTTVLHNHSNIEEI